MTNEEAVRILHEESCAYCSWGASSPDNCDNDDCDVKAALDLAISALERDRWISVEERLPEHHNWCLVLGENLYDMDFINSRGVWNTHDKPFSKILFWRPLPEPPKEET